MSTQFSSVPFTIPNVYEGFAEAHGLLKLTQPGVVLEFQVKDGLVGLIKSRVNEVTVPLDEIVSVELKKGWFQRRLLLRCRSLATLANIPKHKSGTIALRIARDNMRVAREVVSMLRVSLAERHRPAEVAAAE